MDRRETLKNFIVSDVLGGMTGIQLGYDDDLLLSGLINSLGVMRLVAFTQTQFGIEVPMEDVVIENFQTIEAIATYLKTRD
jgi:acyl carrier protein